MADWSGSTGAPRRGASLWSTGTTTSPPPRVVTDGARLFAWFGTGQLVALDLDGRELWSRHLGRDYGPFDVLWGHGSSPQLYEDLLILQCDHPAAAYLLALDHRHRRGTLGRKPRPVASRLQHAADRADRRR